MNLSLYTHKIVSLFPKQIISYPYEDHVYGIESPYTSKWALFPTQQKCIIESYS